MKTLVKPFYGGVRILTAPIRSARASLRRRRLLNDPDVIALLRSAWTAGVMAEPFDTWLGGMKS